MKKKQLQNIFTQTILASSILYAEQVTAAPCVYSFESKTIGGNIVCSSTKATENPFSSTVSTIKFNGTVTIPANKTAITNTGVSGMTILGGNVNFTKAVSVTDVLVTSNAEAVFITQGNTTMAGGITISNANAPLTSGMQIRGDNATTTNFSIASITASNNDSWGLWINNKITSGIISGAVNISNTDRNSRNSNPVYGILIDLSATPVFNGVVTLTNNQIASGGKIGLGTGIQIASNAYAKFNNTVNISVPPFVATSNTTGVQVTNAKADFATLKTENHKLHVGVDNSTVVINGPLTILEAWSLGAAKTGIKAINAGNLNLKSTLDILGGVTYGVDISGASTLVNFTKAVNIVDNYNAINISSNGKGVFNDSVTINRVNGVITNSQGISIISGGSGQFDGAVTVSNMDNKALNIQGSSPVFNNTVTLADNKTGIYVDGTSVPVFNKAVTTNNKIVSGVFNSNNDIKISGANAKASFVGGVSITNSLTGISLDTSANPTFGGNIIITQDLSASGNTKLLPTDAVLFTTSSTGKFDGTVAINNMTNRALNIQSASPVFNNIITLVDNKTGVYVDGVSAPVFNKEVRFYNTMTSGVFNSNNDIKLSGVDSKAIFKDYVDIRNSLIGISLDTKANPTFAKVHIALDSKGALNTKSLATDGILFTGASTGTFGDLVDVSYMTNRGINIQSSSPVFNDVAITDNKTGIYIDGTSAPVFNKTVNSYNTITAGVFNSNNDIKITGANTKAVFKNTISLTNSLVGISLDTSANPTFAAINITQDLSATGNTKLLPTDGILFTTSSTGTFGGAISISNMTNRALNIQSSSPVFNAAITLEDNRNGIYIDGTSNITFNQPITSNNKIVAGVFNTDNSIKISGANAKVSFLGTINITNSLTGISLDTNANPTFGSVINITQDLTANTKLLPTDGIAFTSSTGKIDSFLIISNMTNRALNIQNSSPVFNNVIQLADNKTGIYVDGTSAPVFNKSITTNNKIVSGVFNSNNDIKISGANAKANFANTISITNSLAGISLDTSANPTFAGSISITQDLSASGNTKLLPTDGIVFAGSSTGKFDSFLVISNMTNRALNIQSSSPVFNDTISLADNKTGIYIDGTSLPVFNKSITSNNKIVSGVFNSDTSIKLSGANAKANFVSGITITNSLTGISLDTKANSTFSGPISITQDLSASGNTKLLPTDGISITSSSTAKFDSTVIISNMTNRGLNIQNSSAAFNKSVLLSDNKIGAFISQGSDVTFVDGISGSYNSSSSSANTIGLHAVDSKVTSNKAVNIKDHETNILADNSTILFTDVVSVQDSGLNTTPKTGIKLINASNATLNSTVNINLGPNPPVGAALSTGISISGTNTIGTFKGLVRSENTLSPINISNGGKGIFAGTVAISKPNPALIGLQGINISSADADFSGGVGIVGMDLPAINIKQSAPSFNITNIASSKQGILIDSNSAPIFTNSVTINRPFNHPTIPDELQTYAMTVDNKSSVTINGAFSTANINKSVVLDHGSSASFGGNIVMDDQRNFAFPSNGMSLDNSSQALISKDITLTNLNGYGLSLYNNSTATVKGILTASKIAGKALYVGSGSKIVLEQPSIFTGNGTAMQFDNASTVNSVTEVVTLTNNKYDVDINNTVVNFTKAFTSNNTITSGDFTSYNSIKISGASSTGTFSGPVTISNSLTAISLDTSANPTFADVTITQDLSANTKLLPTDGILFTNAATGKFDGAINISNMTNRALNIQSSSPVFNNTVTLADNKMGIYVDGTSTPVFNKAVTTNNKIVSGVFNSDNDIKISGANAKANFVGPISITNSLTGISLDSKANPTFADVTITQDLSASGNTKLLPTDGVLFANAATGTFGGAVNINKMTNRALNIHNSSPIFNNTLSLLDNKNGIFMDGASAPVFNKSVNISKTDTINVPVEIGVEITDSSTPTFVGDLSVTKNKYGISISDNSNATFVGVVDVNNNRGPVLGDPFSPIGVYGIKIIDNSNATFKGDVVIADNYYKHIVDVNPSAGYALMARGVYIEDNSSAYFAGSVSTSMLNHPQQLSEGIRINNNSSADFDGSVSTSSHYQGILVDNSSKATFNNNVQMLEERLTVPLNNSSGLTVDNSSEVLVNSDITANGFWRAGIEVNNGSIANFKGVVTAKNNLSPVANTATTMDFGSTAINISDSTVTFDKQPVLDGNYNAIKITGATSDVTFSTDLLFTNNKSYGINLADISAINFKNITYNSDSVSYFSTFLNSKASKVTFDGTVECNSGLCLKIQDTSDIVFNDTFTANNTSIPSPFLLNTTAINSQQSTQLIFNKVVNIDSFYTGINSIEDDYLSFRDTVKITNTKGFGINLLQSQLAEFKTGVSIEGELNGSSGYGIYVGGYFSAPDPHQVIFYGDVDIKNQYTGIYLENSNVEFQKVVNVESGINQSSGYGIYIPAQVNDSSLNKVVFADDVTIKNQSLAGLYLEKNNTVFNGNVTIEDSYHSLFSNASVDVTTNPTPIFNKNVTINNGVNGILVTGGELIFNGPVVINKSSFKGMNIASGGNNGENSKLYFNDTVEVNDCVVGISTYNEFASNYLTFEKGLTINNPNIAANQEVFMDHDDSITFNGDSPVNAQIEGGIVTFTGAPTISRTIQDAQIVDFTISDPSKRISVNADIGGTDIYTNSVIMGIDSNITFTGNLHSDNTIFDLSSKILTIDGNFTHGTNPVAKFASFALAPLGGITIDTYYDGTNAGHFEFATPSTVIDLSNSSQMIINITEAPGLPVLLPGETRQFDLFVGNGVSNFQLIDVSNITINSNNPLSKWTIDTQEGIISQSLDPDGVGNMFKMVDSDGVTDPLMASEEFVQELLDIIMSKGPFAGADALAKIGTPGAVVAASAPLSNIETGIIDTRLSSVTGAGDEEPIYGAWFAPLYGKATQKQREEQPGFKSTYFGGIIGFDSKIDEYLSVGIAAGMSDGKLNHTNSNKGDRTDHKAYVGIIYLSYDLTERWMLQNTFSYGFSRVHNKEIRISTPVNKIARAKYDERRISNNIGLGYKTLLSNEMLLIPFFALDFNRVGSINYTETGADVQNLKFSRSSLMEIDGIIGARLSRNFQYDDFVITPAVVANMRYAISGKEFTTDVRLAADDTIQIVPKTVAPARKLYRLGASVNINNKDKDFLINYEFRKAEKFTSHQGSLKLQISF